MENRCKYSDCKNKALSLTDFCWEHIMDKAAYKQSITDHLSSGGSLKDFYFHRADLSSIDFTHADCDNADFTSCNLYEVSFVGANMSHCNLAHANLYKAQLDNADLSDAYLVRSNLAEARMWHADLKRANISEADMRGADLLYADLSEVKFWNVKIKDARLLSRENFLCRKGKYTGKYAIDEKGVIAAAEGYRNLKQYFIHEGKYDDVSWASFKEKQMQRRQLFKKNKLAYIPSLVMAIVCGYGEKPSRIIAFSSGLIFLYALIYYFTSAINAPFHLTDDARFWDCLYFSIVTFTTLGFGDITPKPIPIFQMLAASQAFLGVFTMGLFIFTLARRYSAR